MNRLGRDRSLRLSDLAVTLFVLLGACARVPPPPKGDEIHRPELWVDAFSPPGGDGSSARPFKAVPQPAPRGALVHLRSGLYPGPFVLGEGARLEGRGEVVLTGEAGQTVITAVDASLDGVSVQGGAIGLEAGQGVTATRVRFSGQRSRAVAVHGGLTMSEARFEASVEGIDGISVDRGAALELSNGTFTGGFRRAVMTEGGTIDLQSVSAEGPRTLVHAVEGTTRLSKVRSVLGAGPAMLFAAGTVTVKGAELIGHEYSVQVTRGADANFSDLHARGGLEACITAIGSTLSLSSSTLTECGTAGALSLLDSKTQLQNVEVTSSRELAVFVRKGTLRLMGLKVSNVASDGNSLLGDALHVRDAVVSGGPGVLSFSDLGGSGVFVGAWGELNVPNLLVERARSSAIFVENGGQATIGSLLVRGGKGPAIVVPDRASVSVETLSVAGGTEMPVYAECAAGAKVTLGRLESTVAQLPSHCLTIR